LKKKRNDREESTWRDVSAIFFEFFEVFVSHAAFCNFIQGLPGTHGIYWNILEGLSYMDLGTFWSFTRRGHGTLSRHFEMYFKKRPDYIYFSRTCGNHCGYLRNSCDIGEYIYFTFIVLFYCKTSF
jgi:hypothetical protein